MVKVITKNKIHTTKANLTKKDTIKNREALKKLLIRTIKKLKRDSITTENYICRKYMLNYDHLSHAKQFIDTISLKSTFEPKPYHRAECIKCPLNGIRCSSFFIQLARKKIKPALGAEIILAITEEGKHWTKEIINEYSKRLKEE